MSGLRGLYEAVDRWFDGLLGHCRGCRDDCLGPVWLVAEEAQRLAAAGVSVLEVNGRAAFINSFPSTPDGRIDVSAYKPRCRQYRAGMCRIYDARPLACRTYPVVIEGMPEGLGAMLHLDCRLAGSLGPAGEAALATRVLQSWLSVDGPTLGAIEESCREVEWLLQYPAGPNHRRLLTLLPSRRERGEDRCQSARRSLTVERSLR